MIICTIVDVLPRMNYSCEYVKDWNGIEKAFRRKNGKNKSLVTSVFFMDPLTAFVASGFAV